MFQSKRLSLFIIVALIGTQVIPPRVTRAEPNAPVGCTFFVNSTSVDTTTGFQMTLPVAVMLANGGTGPTGLNRTMTNNEMLQIGGAGCSWDGDGNLLTGGGGYVDTIRFSNNIGINPTIVLAPLQPLPGLIDTSGDTLDGSYTGIYPTIDATAIGPNQDGISVKSNATVNGVRVTGAPRYDFNVNNTGNHLINVAAWKAGQVGIWIANNNNTVDGALVGVAATNSANCGSGSANKGNVGSGIRIETYLSMPNAQHNVIKNSVIGCNGSTGVTLTGSGTLNNTIGPNNSIGIGVNQVSDLGNTASGVFVASGATNNQIVTNTIGMNGLLGVSTNGNSTLISGNIITSNMTSGVYSGNAQDVIIANNTIAENVENGVDLYNANSNHVGDNLIIGNVYDGVLIEGTSSTNTIGGPALSSNLHGNVLSGNSRYGLDIQGPAYNNLVLANGIGHKPYDSTVALGNHIGGILIDGSNSNTIGDPTASPNRIGGNLLNGVLLTNGAKYNILNDIYVGVNLPNGLNGIVISSGANNNTIRNSYSNYNGGSGLVIQGSTTATNTVTASAFISNTADGIRLADNTFDNQIDAAVDKNMLNRNWQGIHLLSGAHHNTIGDNYVESNRQYGVQLADAGTQDNVITGTVIANNALASIDESGGALNNIWSHLVEAHNGGLGIDEHNPGAAKPVIMSVTKPDANTTVITGTASATYLFVASQVELYQAMPDPSGYGEGAAYLGTATTNMTGTWAITLTGAFYGSGPICFTAFETTSQYLFGTSSASSEWGPQTCHALYLPPILR